MGKAEGLPDRLSDQVISHFPNLEADGYEITNPRDRKYNCIAYAAGDEGRWWAPTAFPSPGYYWPERAERGRSLEALRSCFKAVGYEVCEDGEPEDGFTKVALYADDDGIWQHAARQLDGGEWTSKLGGNEDIRHRTPGCVGGPTYGSVGLFMRRRIKSK